jgi:hypothetical protein
MKQSKFPPGWDEERVKRVLAHYESQTEEEAVAEDESSFEALEQTVMEIPTELVPKVRELIAKHRAAWTTANQALERDAANSAAPLSLRCYKAWRRMCDSEPDWKEERVRALKESLAFFSNKEKLNREKWVVRRLLRALPIDFEEEEMTGAEEPVMYHSGMRDSR